MIERFWKTTATLRKWVSFYYRPIAAVSWLIGMGSLCGTLLSNCWLTTREYLEQFIALWGPAKELLNSVGYLFSIVISEYRNLVHPPIYWSLDRLSIDPPQWLADLLLVLFFSVSAASRSAMIEGRLIERRKIEELASLLKELKNCKSIKYAMTLIIGIANEIVFLASLPFHKINRIFSEPIMGHLRKPTGNFINWYREILRKKAGLDKIRPEDLHYFTERIAIYEAHYQDVFKLIHVTLLFLSISFSIVFFILFLFITRIGCNYLHALLA